MSRQIITNQVKLVILQLVLVLALRSPAVGETAQTNMVPEIKATTDRAEAVYKVGEKVLFKIEAVAPELAAEEAKAVGYTLMLNNHSNLASGTINLMSGPKEVEYEFKKPGWVDRKSVV